MKKSIMSTSIMLTMALVMVSGVFAQSVNDQDSSPVAVEPEIVAVYSSIDGVLTEISIEKYRQIIEEAKQVELQKEQIKSLQLDQVNAQKQLSPGGVVTPQALFYNYAYNESGYISHAVRYSLNRRVTPAVRNLTSSNALHSFAASVTETWGANVSITGSGKISAITLGISTGATWQSSVSGTHTVTGTIKPNNYGWIEFTPYHTNSYGNLNEKIWSITTSSTVLVSDTNQWLDIYTPKKLTGPNSSQCADGLYTVRESSSPPN